MVVIQLKDGSIADAKLPCLGPFGSEEEAEGILRKHGFTQHGSHWELASDRSAMFRLFPDGGEARVVLWEGVLHATILILMTIEEADFKIS